MAEFCFFTRCDLVRGGLCSHEKRARASLYQYGSVLQCLMRLDKDKHYAAGVATFFFLTGLQLIMCAMASAGSMHGESWGAYAGVRCAVLLHSCQQ